jgi:electron transport complex protein RnfC
MMKLKTFPGGLHPPDNKEWSAHKAIETCPLPAELVIPLAQHIGAPADLCVAKGDLVKKGQVIGTAKVRLGSGAFVNLRRSDSGRAPAACQRAQSSRRGHPPGRRGRLGGGDHGGRP